jgi:hypothetical protein
MTEACDAVTDYWFDVLREPVLRVPKAANGASRRISEIAAEEWFLGKSPKNNC